MDIIVQTDETKITNWRIEGNSATGLVTPFSEIVSYITTVGTELGAIAQGFQIIMFVEGTLVPNRGNTKLGRGIIAEVTYSHDGVVVRAGDLDEDGYGNTLEEASLDFLTSLCDRYDSLYRRRQSLAETEINIFERLHTALGKN